MKLTTALVAAATVLVPSVALGHPGHGATAPQSWGQYLTEPVHFGGVAAVALVAILVERARVRRRAPR